MLYSWEPPLRADYATMILKPSKTENWYEVKKGIIHLNDFKNVKSFGARSFNLTEVVKKNLNNYVSILNYILKEESKYLLYQVMSEDLKPFTREIFSVYFKRLMYKYTHKNLTINGFRHIFETHIINDPEYNKMTINEKKKIHERLLHSWKTGAEYAKVEKE